jgi:hypothetical protein
MENNTATTKYAISNHLNLRVSPCSSEEEARAEAARISRGPRPDWSSLLDDPEHIYVVRDGVEIAHYYRGSEV